MHKDSDVHEQQNLIASLKAQRAELASQVNLHSNHDSIWRVTTQEILGWRSRKKNLC